MVLYEAILVSCEFMLGTFWDPTDLGPYKNQPWLCSPKTKNAYFLPLSTAPVPCKSQIISDIDDRSELVLAKEDQAMAPHLPLAAHPNPCLCTPKSTPNPPVGT